MSNLASAGCPSRSASVGMGRSAYFRLHRRWLASGLVRIGWVVLGVAVLSLAACQGDGTDDAASSTTSTAPTTAAPAPFDPCATFAGSITALQSVGATAPASLTDAEAGADGRLDRVTFTLRSVGVGNAPPPGYVVGYQNPAQAPSLDGDPPEPISLPGEAFLVVRIAPAVSIDPFAEGQPATYTGNLSLDYGDHHHLQIVRRLPDAPDTVVWVIGLDSLRPFRVDRSEDPRAPGMVRVSVLIG